MWSFSNVNHCNEVQQGTYIGTLTVSFYVEGIDEKIKRAYSRYLCRDENK